jgi:threonine dehydrogenase-like Zn-dependent dehydrogenase
VAVLGLGPIGLMAARVARYRGAEQVIGIDLVPERLARAREANIVTFDLREHEDVAASVRELTGGRGPDAVIDAVGMEAHGDHVGKLAQTLAGLMPDPVEAKLMSHSGMDRMGALHTAIDMVRRGGTISLLGVYGGMSDPMPMLTLFDKQIQLRMGQANVKRWIPEILPVLLDGDPFGVEGFASHHLPLDEAPRAYELFQTKSDGAFKMLLHP